MHMYFHVHYVTYMYTHGRRGSKDYNRPVGFVSAGVQGATQDKDDEGDGNSDSGDEVRMFPFDYE